MFKKFNVLIFEERTLIMIFKSGRTNLSIKELLYWGIEQSSRKF
jgi:hypothetical protein